MKCGEWVRLPSSSDPFDLRLINSFEQPRGNIERSCAYVARILRIWNNKDGLLLKMALNRVKGLGHLEEELGWPAQTPSFGKLQRWVVEGGGLLGDVGLWKMIEWDASG